MAAGTIPLASATDSQLRPVDLRRDLRQIAGLMDTCFGDTLDQGGRGAVREMESLSRNAPMLWLIGAMVPQWQLGFVWVENGRVVGNISTQMSEFDRGTWLIANVAVHPDYRRRGIATALTEAALNLAASNQARRVQLQVHQRNTTAYNMYLHLGFQRVTARVTWERAGVFEPAPAQVPGCDLRPARRDEWESDFNFVAQQRPAGFSWLRPLRKRDWQPSLWRSVQRFVTGTREEHWLAIDQAGGRLAGAFYLATGFGANDDLSLIVHPDWQGRLERPLLAAALRRLGRRPWTVRADHPTPDAPAEAAFQEFGFRQLQTLVWMDRNFR